LVALAGEAVTEPPALADVATLLDQLPLFADRFAELPPSELRALFEIVQLELAFHPAGGAIDVGVMLSLDPPPDDCQCRGASSLRLIWPTVSAERARADTGAR
jgi:hypothetical protein